MFPRQHCHRYPLTRVDLFIVFLPCRGQQQPRLENISLIPWLCSKPYSNQKKKILVEEKGLKAQRQIPLCPSRSLKHYFKVVLKRVPITWRHLSLPSMRKSYSSPVQTDRIRFYFSVYQSLIPFPSPGWEPFSEVKGRKLLSSLTTFACGELEQGHHLCTHLGAEWGGGENWRTVLSKCGQTNSFPLIFLMRSDCTHLSNEGHRHTQKPKTPEKEARDLAAAATHGQGEGMALLRGCGSHP